MGRMYVTIDTEMDADPHWKKRSPMEFTSVTEGIPKYLRPIWDRYDVHPIYFVSPEVAENPACAEILKAEASRGAIIGAHLHPEYIGPDRITDIDSIKKAAYPCYACDRETEASKLRNLRDLIEKNIGVRPVWYRAARFGADEETFSILDELGFKFDSSCTPHIDWSDRGGPDHSPVPIRAFKIEPYDIIEYPVTITGRRWGIIGRMLPDNWLFYKWIRPSHMTLFEEKVMLKRLRKDGIEDIVMMFHSMEVMVNKTPYVRNKLMQKMYLRRLDRTVRYACKFGYKP